MSISDLLNDCPLIAILRGIKPEEIDAVSAKVIAQVEKATGGTLRG